MRFRRAASLSLPALLLVASTATADPAAPALELWVRAPGRHASGEGPMSVVGKELRLERLPLREAMLFDFQYDKELKVRGLSLDAIVAELSPNADLDLALIHFEGGMIVPVRLGGSEGEIFVATAWWSERDKAWREKFPDASRNPDGRPKFRPIRFTGPKIVVKSGSHEMVSEETAAHFSPWRHVDSPVGVELANEAAYYRQLDLGVSSGGRAGFTVFKDCCQFCHAVSGIGAHHGWDFVAPVPVFDYRGTNEKLYMHTRYREADALERGLAMPALPHMTVEKSGQILAWIKEVANRAIPEYRP